MTGPENSVDRRIPVFLPSFAKLRQPPQNYSNETKSKLPQRPGIETIWPNMCMHFLRDGCVESDRCLRSHELPDGNIIYQRLCEHDAGHIAQLFHVIIVRCAKLLQLYFTNFLDYFGMHWQRDDLIKTISICEPCTNIEMKTQYFQHLVLAFMRSGMSYEATMQTIFAHMKNQSNRSKNVVLNASIVENVTIDGLPRVIRTLLSRRMTIEPPIINRLMIVHLNSHDTQLANVIVSIIHDLPAAARSQLSGDVLQQFMLHAFSNTMN